MAFHDILRHMLYGIKLHKVGQYGNQKNHIDLKSFTRKKILKKMQHSKNSMV